jgi:hypothetical protein
MHSPGQAYSTQLGTQSEPQIIAVAADAGFAVNARADAIAMIASACNFLVRVFINVTSGKMVRSGFDGHTCAEPQCDNRSKSNNPIRRLQRPLIESPLSLTTRNSAKP